MKNSDLVLVVIFIAAAFGFYYLYEKNKLQEQTNALLAQQPTFGQTISAAGAGTLAGLITTLGSSATSWLSGLGGLTGSPAGSAAPITSGSSTSQVGPQNGSAPVSGTDVNSAYYNSLAEDNGFDSDESL